MARKKNTKTVNVRLWEQAGFLPKINFPAGAQVSTPPLINGGNVSMPDCAQQIHSKSVRKTGNIKTPKRGFG